MKVALVHDYLVQYGGAERVLECFAEIFPKAPIFTMVYDKKLVKSAFAGKKIITSFLQKIPFVGSHHRLFPLLMPMAIESFDLSEFDVVLSDSNSYAKGAITAPYTLHICYCHTPMRYAWDDCHRRFQEFGYSKITKKFIPLAMNYLRLWDKISANRPDKYLANSEFVAERIRKYYQINSTVIHPPVDTGRFQIYNREEKKLSSRDYYLMVGRALPYKKFDIAIEAFNKLGLPLKIIGEGPEIKKLQKIAREGSVEFLGYLSDEKTARYCAGCKALIFPQEEDFGITALETMACGRPVIAYRGGGALETVVENETGIFFDDQTPEAIIGAVKKFGDCKFNPEEIRKRALEFDKEIFKERIKEFIEKEYRNFKFALIR